MAIVMEASILFSELTEQEERAGHSLTLEQIKVLKNDEAIAIRNIVNLEFDATNPIKFAQDQATLQAQINFIQFLIQRNEATKENTNGTI